MDVLDFRANWLMLLLFQWSSWFTTASSPPLVTPSFCNQEICPLYSVVEKYDRLELRCYQASLWVSMQGRGMLYSDNLQLPTWRIHRYFQGYNHLGSEVPVGMPVARLFDESRNIFSYDFFVPNSYRGKIPQPNDSNIEIVYRRAFCAYVYSFKGWFTTIRSLRNYKNKTLHLLRKRNLYDKVYNDFYFFAAYGSLWKSQGQQNEIWMVSKFGLDSKND